MNQLALVAAARALAFVATARARLLSLPRILPRPDQELARARDESASASGLAGSDISDWPAVQLGA